MSFLSQATLKMDHSLRLLMIVFSASVLLSSPAMADCPYDVPACECTGQTLLCTNLDDLPPLVSNNQDGSITNLTFHSGTLNIIPANGLPANLQTLVFSNVQITSVSRDAFSSSSATLKSVSINKITYTELPEALFELNILTELKMSDVTITNWRPEVLQFLGKTLRSVAFVNVGLTSWPVWLKDFTLVNYVDLSNNNIQTISSDAFTNIRNLTRLKLQNTSLSDVNNFNNALAPVRSTLEILDISINKFTEIPSSLANMPRLSILLAVFNRISKVTSDRISPNLKRLYIPYNSIETLTDTSFPPSSALEVLSIGLSLLSGISDLAFLPLQNLRELSLTTTYLTTIPLALAKLPNLNILEMTTMQATLTCYCPRDDQLVRWFQSLKNITVYGDCQSNSNNIKIASYLGSVKPPCDGFNHLKSNLFLYLLLGILMTVYLL